MNPRLKPITVALLIALLSAVPCYGWGDTGHHIVNGLAADGVPAGPLQEFLKQHRAYLVEHAVDPDLWREKDPQEGYHHFIDIDRYGQAPFLNLPRSLADAEERFGIDAVEKNGLLPWSVENWFVRLVDAMRRNDTSSALMDAAILGHYAADAHVPFHAVENYDGQLTGQKGIHARWESDMVNNYIHPETLKSVPVRYIDDPVSATIGWATEGALMVPGILDAEKAVHARNPDVTSTAYRDAFWQATGAGVQQRLEQAAGDVASLWYSAWIVAGQPKLDAPVKEITDTFALRLNGVSIRVPPSQSELASKRKFGVVSPADAAVTSALDAGDLAGAHKLVGKQASFRGTVSAVYAPANHEEVTLNFAPDYRAAVTGLIKAASFSKLPDLMQLEGKTVLVSGIFTEESGAPAIEISSADQVKVVK